MFNSNHPHIFSFLDKLENYIKLNSINEPHKYRNFKSKKQNIYTWSGDMDKYVENVAHFFGDFDQKKID